MAGWRIVWKSKFTGIEGRGDPVFCSKEEAEQAIQETEESGIESWPEYVADWEEEL